MATKKPSRPNINFDGAYDDLTTSAQVVADSRFNVAKGVLELQPNALAVPHEKTQETSNNSQIRSDELVEGQIYELPLQRFTRSENNARVFYSADELDATAISLKTQGQDVPVIGYVRDNKVILVDGGKRFQAATSAGLETLRVEIGPAPASEAEEYEKSRRVNVTRSTQTAIDDAIRWNDLLKRKVYETHEHLAERNNVGRSLVTRTVQLVAIPEMILRKMNGNEKTRSLSTAYEIYRIYERLKDSPDVAAQIAEEVIDEICKESMNRNDAKALIDARLDPKLKIKRTRETPSSSELRFGQAIGTLKIFPAKKKLDLSFTNLEEAQIGRLKDMIEKMLSEQLELYGGAPG